MNSPITASCTTILFEKHIVDRASIFILGVIVVFFQTEDPCLELKRTNSATIRSAARPSP